MSSTQNHRTISADLQLLMMECHEHVLDALSTSMRARSSATGLDWIERERRAVTDAANRWAGLHGKEHVTVEEVEFVERLAVGHVDYARKFALYVAELVVGVRPRRIGTAHRTISGS